jgi:hypothetical protein
MIRSFALILVSLFGFVASLPALCCPFCPGSQGQSLSGEYKAADLIVVGVVKNAKQNLEDPSKNTTELHIVSVVKDHPYLAGKKMLILPRYYPPESLDADGKVLVFAGVYPKVSDTALAGLAGGGVLADFNRYTFDPYRGDPMSAKAELATYLKESMALFDKPVPERLQFYFKYLDSQDLAISGDAFNEFSAADYKDLRAAAAKLPTAKIAEWLADPNTPASHFGLYGLILGHSGRKQDAAVLRKMLDEPKKFYSSGIDGLLGGYILLEPEEGWKYLDNIIKTGQNFDQRYAALRTLRFFWEFRSDVVKKEKLLESIKLLFAQTDIADMPIEDLRKWKCEDLTADILALAKSPTHVESPFVRRALMKYLVAIAPKNADASGLIAGFRAKHPEWVKAAEEALASEIPAATTTPVKTDVKPAK